MITNEEVIALIDTAERTMKDDYNWSEEDANAGLIYMTMLVIQINQMQLPILNNKFPEILRILANVYELFNSKLREKISERKDKLN